MDEVALLVESCLAMGIELSEKQQEQFAKYQSLLLCWNEKMNLTTIIEPRDIAIKHFADSISIGAKATGIPFEKQSLIDIGTGAGFPGIPLKIVFPELQVTLLDSLQKKVGFLNTVIAELSLEGITAIHSRAEDAGQNQIYRERYDYVVSRAVAPMERLVEYCLPFVKLGGMLLSLKGPDVTEEMAGARDAIFLLGGSVVSVAPVEIPCSDLHHSLVMIQKLRQTPKAYPRKAGKPRKKSKQ